MIKHLFFPESVIFCLFLMAVCCVNKKVQIDFEAKRNLKRSVVLIFDHASPHSRYIFPTGITNNSGFEVRYIGDNYLLHEYSPNSDVVDTIVLHTNREIIEIQHCYKGIDRLRYFFTNGDTVVFQYTDKTPFVSVKNRFAKYYDNNYDVNLRKSVFKNDFPARLKYMFPFAFEKPEFSRGAYKTMYLKTIEESARLANHQSAGERKFLDSLLDHDLISKDYFDFYKLQNQYSVLSLLVRQKKNKADFIHSFDDSLVYYTFYTDFLDDIIYQYYSEKVDKIKNGNAIVPDYTAIYDSIKINDSFTQKTKNVLLRKTLEEIIQAYPLDKVKPYVNEFQKRDTIAAAYLTEKFRLNYDNSSQLSLLTTNGKIISFDSLKKMNAGKLIYVDFWASWCGPCIQQFPFSKELKKKYEGKNISFIYLSMDTDSSKWKRASNKYKLENSFLINNRYSSTLVKELEVSSIPRYLLYDKKGKLVHRNAPRPGGEAIVKLIEEYLVKQ